MRARRPQTNPRVLRARCMRHNPSVAEEVVWKLIRRGALGYKFRGQTILLQYTVDFYCPRLKLALEMDGEQHDIQADAKRDADLAMLGVEVFRIPNRSFFELDGPGSPDWLQLLKRRCDEKSAENPNP